jgi:thioredoxin 1
MYNRLVIIDSNNFDESIKAHRVILIDFWADWCRPCKMFSPILDEISKEYSLWIGKINADENKEKAAEYNIISLPTTIIFENGKEIKRILGAKPKHIMIKELESWI